MSVRSLREVLSRGCRRGFRCYESSSVTWKEAKEVFDWINLGDIDVKEIGGILGNPSDSSSLSLSDLLSAIKEATTEHTADNFEKEVNLDGINSYNSESRRRRSEGADVINWERLQGIILTVTSVQDALDIWNALHRPEDEKELSLKEILPEVAWYIDPKKIGEFRKELARLGFSENCVRSRGRKKFHE
jgi:hypothetical protein